MLLIYLYLPKLADLVLLYVVKSVLTSYSLDLIRFSTTVPYEHLYTYCCYVHGRHSSVAMELGSIHLLRI